MLLLLLSCFSRVRLCATPWTAAYQAPLSVGFSRQEYWSGVPLPSPFMYIYVCVCVCVCVYIYVTAADKKSSHKSFLSIPKGLRKEQPSKREGFRHPFLYSTQNLKKNKIKHCGGTVSQGSKDKGRSPDLHSNQTAMTNTDPPLWAGCYWRRTKLARAHPRHEGVPASPFFLPLHRDSGETTWGSLTSVSSNRVRIPCPLTG